MDRTRTRVFAALTAAFLAAVLAAPAAAAIDPAAVRSTVAGLLESRGLVGLSVAVVENGATALAEGFGVRSRATGQPVAADTMFAIGSITKQFTAACVLLLAEDGKLAVTDKVAKWYPALTRASDITLLDLMNHVSGYADYYPLDFVDRPMAAATPSDEVIRRFATRPLDFEPGARYSYSNTGYLILGRVVEKVSGEPFGAFLDRRILKPLGMAHTVFEPDPLGPSCARGHMSFWLGAPEIVPLEGRGWVAAAGALFSTPSDLVTWDLALVDGKVRNWGCDLLPFFDLVLSSSAATFQYDNLAIGTFPAVGTIMLGQSAGFAASLQTFLTGHEMTAAQALELGLVSRVHPREELVVELKKTLAHLTTISTPVTGLMLRNLRRAKHETFQRFIDESYTDYLNILTDLEDFSEGGAAWVDRRPPAWKNR